MTKSSTNSILELLELWKIGQFLIVLVVTFFGMRAIYYSPFDQPIIVLVMFWMLLFPVIFGLFFFRILQPEIRQSVIAICGIVMCVTVAVYWLYYKEYLIALASLALGFFILLVFFLLKRASWRGV